MNLDEQRAPARADVHEIAAAPPRECSTDQSQGACTGPAEHYARGGCVHEHIREGWLCRNCLALLQSGLLTCGPCRQGPASHRCTLIGWEVRQDRDHMEDR